MRRTAVVLAVAALAALAIGARGDPAPSTPPTRPPSSSGAPASCEAVRTHRAVRRLLRRRMLSPRRLTRRRGARLWRAVRCSERPRAAGRYLRRLRARRRRLGAWGLRWLRVEPWLRRVLAPIAACESGGDPGAIGGGGLYRGKYQFDRGTWGSVGGRGDPAAAPEREQDVRAARLYRWQGAAPWPVCGR